MSEKKESQIKGKWTTTYDDIKDLVLAFTDNNNKMDDILLLDKNAKIKDQARDFMEEFKAAQDLYDYNLGTTRTILFTGAPGLGKAVRANTLIVTKWNFTEARNVRIGEEICDGRGKLTTVCGKFPQGIMDIYKITFDDDSYIEVTKDHINRLWLKDDEPLDITTDKLLEENDYNKYYIIRPLTNEHCYNKIAHIKNIEYVGKDEAICFMVESRDQTYLCNNYIPTHNTFLAKIMATELKLPIYIVDISSTLENPESGLPNLRKIFDFVTNPKNQPCILFMDECDGLAQSRENNKASLADNRCTNYIMQVLNEQNESKESRLIVMAASNFESNIDEAFLSRFQLRSVFYVPEHYVPYIKLEVKKNKMFKLIEDVDEEQIGIVDTYANKQRFGIRELNAKILWCEKRAVIEAKRKGLLDGEVLELKLSDILQEIANHIKLATKIIPISTKEKKYEWEEGYDEQKDMEENKI